MEGSRWRALFSLFLAAFVLFGTVADAAAVGRSRAHSTRAAKRAPAGNPRAALLMIDADSGKVIFSENATARRYPASLTKVMTIYLAFEALEQGKMSMSTMLPVSAKAAGMPSTNLSLRAGQRISAKDAIEALVVQSANDAAVVLAEYLGSTTWGFALKMTAKARALGMENTVFRNPNGLPDPQQYTTAKDLAMLAVAMRRDFPQYYPMFKLKSCSYKGRTYYSHNRAMWRIPGADGLKTGFINASGFNLITTVARGGRHVVGVVMGGYSGKSRDDQMVRMIEQTYANLGKAPNTSEIASGYLPLRKAPGAGAVAPSAGTLYASAPVVLPDTKIDRKIVSRAPLVITPAAPAESERPVVLDAPKKPTPAVQRVLASAAPASPAVMGSAPQYLRLPEKAEAAAPARASGQFQPVSYASPATGAGGWGIQVGAYSGQQDALMAANQAVTVAGSSVAGAQINVSGSTAAGQTIHRARLVNLSESKAREACRALISRNASCFVYRTDVASQL